MMLLIIVSTMQCIAKAHRNLQAIFNTELCNKLHCLTKFQLHTVEERRHSIRVSANQQDTSNILKET
ncbi:hypothetical protein HanXRQr2_Chr13g0615631 [Helianthus annuus]|uniref:Secreted protein n=1 Tax=Helianthus annuus TaxID=4232 RepID=A0A9K3EL02_HELAN|nr:hypothetical protein HanXRQr2_Chr13g0615631 [Helianthus annuus]